jgi:nucleoredoxin
MRTSLPLTLAFFALVPLHAEELTADSLQNLPDFHPREVTVLVPLAVPILINGQQSGEIKLPAGRTLPVKEFSDGLITVSVGPNASIDVPIGDTDALARARTLAEQHNAKPQPSPASVIAQKPVQNAQEPLPSPSPDSPPKSPHAFAARITGDLVRLEKRELVSVDPSYLTGKKFIVLYHSAAWCGPCRRFTPDLVKFYRRKKSDQDKFEILFVSGDRSEEAMLEYMIDDKMPWPAVAYNRLQTRHPAHDYRVGGIPALVILDETGTPLPELNLDQDYVGARAALEILDKRLRDLSKN